MYSNFIKGDKVVVQVGLPNYEYSWTREMDEAFKGHPEGIVVEASPHLVRVQPTNGWRHYNFHPKEVRHYNPSGFNNDLASFKRKVPQ